jgi:single-strand DNA-binding protein
MPNYNKVMLIGNITRDPRLNYLPSNTPVADFGLAVNRKFKRGDGEKGEDTLFVDCVAFARIAEVINQYVGKGSPIFIEGRLQLDQWQDKQTGDKRSKHKVVVESMQFLGEGKRDGQRQETRAPANPGPAADGLDDEDIPFSPDAYDGQPWIV